MNKFFLLFFSLLLGSLALLGQNGRISGTITDQVSKEKIPFATIGILSETGEFKSGSVSGSDGSFVLNHLEMGTYKLVFKFMGYQSDTLSNVVLSKKSASVNVGNITLRAVTMRLGQVGVMGNAKTSVGTIDRQTYRATDFATAKGGTATDLLSKIPSVSVDPDGAVSVRGTSDFIVYLNGKPTQIDPATLLGQIAVSQIENVEVISVPTARYDSQGKGGIININTKKTGMEGLTFSPHGMRGGRHSDHRT